jgi:DNA mismatch repair protein MutL
MSKIHELSDLLANQIAAGEVIERPASVVKELVENAIDAGASQIDVQIGGAGTDYIRVVDNGQGIAPEDVPIAFKRHATSKITSRHDLFQVMSLGFRGEALPSIASVADVALQTKTAQENGVLYHVRGGQEVAHQTATGRTGTSVTVRELFYNTPARLKYLKRPQTELSKITDIMNRLALASPDIAFRVQHEQRVLLQTAGNGNQQQVLSAIYGLEVAQKLVPIEGKSELFSVSGLLSKPELTRGSRDYLTILMNGRYVKSFSVSNALIKGYGSKLMVGRFPIGVVNITVDPLLVDVNVHPQKAEIRLSHEDELTELMTTIVKARLGQENLVQDAYQNLYGQRPKPSKAPSAPVRQATPISPSDKPFTPSGEQVEPIIIKTRADLQQAPVQAFQSKYAIPTTATSIQPDESLHHQQLEEPVVTPAHAVQQATLDLDDAQTSSLPDLTYIGQMHGTFLFAQGEAGLYLIDQHAAQERINYEYYREVIAEVTNDQQALLVPLVLEYPMQDMLKLADFSDELAQLGLVLEPFGPTSVIVREHPTWFVKGQEEATIREMVDWLLRDGKLTLQQFREKTAIMMSCKRAIKANQHLDDAQAKALLAQLATTQNPYNCPHGRPVLTQFSLKDMEKMFKRIQDSHDSWQEYDQHPY